MTNHDFGDAVWGAMRACEGEETASPASLARFVAAVLDLGITWFDHADIYADGAAETVFGEALSALGPDRGRVRVISKCGVRFPSPGQPGVTHHHYRSDAAYIAAAARGSLQRLKVERIDLYLVHRPDYLMDAAETASALDQLVTDGLIAAYGVSNFSPAQMARLAARCTRPLAANQIELSPLAADALDDGTLDHMLGAGMSAMAWSPLAGGRLVGAKPPDEPRARACHDALKTIANAAGIDDVGPAALAWLGTLPGAPVPVLGTTRFDRLRGLVEGARAIGRLDPQSWYAVLEAARGTRVP